MRRLGGVKPEVWGMAAMAALATACGAPSDPNHSSADASNGQGDSASGPVSDSGAGRDSGFADSGSGGDGSPVDSSSENDVGFVDSGSRSDGTPDSGSESDGSSDSSSGSDVGSSDSASEDASHPDASLEAGPESGSMTGADSGRAESGSPEGGMDAGHTHTGVWRITPIGDSITEDTCGPQLLSQELIQNGHTNFIFVGTETNNQSCSGAPNVESEGHGGYLVTDLLPPPHVATMQDHSAELPMWAANDKSDVLLMQFGTNDVWNGIATQTILQAYTLVLTDYRAVNPNVIMFVAQITPLNPAGCTTCEAGAETLNAAIPAWATSQSTAASPLYVVDVWSAFTASTYLPNSTYTVDGVHPNPAGSALVAQKWYDALVAQGIP